MIDLYPRFVAKPCPPPFGPDGRFLPIPGLRWCLAVMDDDDPTLGECASLLAKAHGCGNAGWPAFSADDRSRARRLLDNVAAKYRAGTLESQAMKPSFDFREMLA